MMKLRNSYFVKKYVCYLHKFNKNLARNTQQRISTRPLKALPGLSLGRVHLWKSPFFQNIDIRYFLSNLSYTKCNIFNKGLTDYF